MNRNAPTAGIAHFARLALTMDRSDIRNDPPAPSPPAVADAGTERLIAANHALREELRIVAAVIDRAKERAETAERDLEEVSAERDDHAFRIEALENERRQLTDVSDDLAKAIEERDEARIEAIHAAQEQGELTDKIAALENEMTTEAHRLSAAWKRIADLEAAAIDAGKQIATLQKFNAAQKQVIAGLEAKEAPAPAPADSPAAGDAAPKMSTYYVNRLDRLPKVKPAPAPRPRRERPAPAPRQPVRAIRQIFDVKTGQWQPA